MVIYCLRGPQGDGLLIRKVHTGGVPNVDFLLVDWSHTANDLDRVRRGLGREWTYLDVTRSTSYGTGALEHLFSWTKVVCGNI